MNRKIQRRDVLRGAGVAGIAAIAGCSDDGGDSDDDSGGNGSGDGFGGMIRFGVLAPETGDLGSLGPIIRDGALLVERQLEDEYDFDVQTGDTETDPQAGISSAQNLVDSGYPAVVGPTSSNVNLQVTRQVLIPNQVVGISPSSTAPAVTDLDDDDYIFRTAPSDALQGPVMAQVVDEDLDASTAGTLYLNDDYGQALEETFVDGFEELGGEITDRVSFEPEQSTYTSQIGSALESDPEALMIVGFPQSGITMFRDYYSNYADDWDGEIVVPDGLIDATLPDEVGNPMNDVWGTAPSAAGPGADFFADLYEEEYDREPGVFNSHAYDGAAVVTLATVAAGGDADGTAIRDNLREVANPPGTEVGPSNLGEAIEMIADGEDVNYQGASSSVDFDENGDMEAVAYDVSRFVDGVIEVQRTLNFGN